MTGVRYIPSSLSPSDPPRCDRPIRQILKILFHSPDRVLCFRADRAFVGQGAASGAVRPAPAIRRYKRGFLRRFAGSTVQHLALELLQQSLPTLSGRLFGDLEAGCDVFPARATEAHDEKAEGGSLQRLAQPSCFTRCRGWSRSKVLHFPLRPSPGALSEEST